MAWPASFDDDRRGSPGGIAIFGSADRRLEADRFEAADVVAIFGDSRLDLRDATVSETPAGVDAVAIFGDVDVHVPEGWRVDLRVTSVFGEVTDRRRELPSATEEADLIVTGLVLFGDLEVRD